MLSTSCLGSFVLSVAADCSDCDGSGLAESLVQAISYAEHCITDDYEVHIRGINADEAAQLRHLRMRRERIEDVLSPGWRQRAYYHRRIAIQVWLDFLANPPAVPEWDPDGEDIPF